MNIWHGFVSRVAGLWQRQERMRDFRREMESHLDLEADELQQSGLSAKESRHAARKTFGNTTLVTEEVRALWSLTWLEGLGRDLRYATRALRKNPGFSAVAVLTLALGIGANTTIFSAIDSLMLRPLPFSHAEQLVRLYATRNNVTIEGFYAGSPSPPDMRDYAQASHSFQDMVIYDAWRKNVSYGDATSEPEQMSVCLVPAAYFQVLDVKPLMGRLFTEEVRLCRCVVGSFAQNAWLRRPGTTEARSVTRAGASGAFHNRDSTRGSTSPESRQRRSN